MRERAREMYTDAGGFTCGRVAVNGASFSHRIGRLEGRALRRASDVLGRAVGARG